MKLTDTDQQLLSLLRENARASTAQIARRLGLSRTTVQSRIERLEREGVISGYTVRVHEEYERGQVRAHIMIAVQPKQMTAVVAALKAMPELRAAFLVASGTAPAVMYMAWSALRARIAATSSSIAPGCVLCARQRRNRTSVT